jgi:hypothetical protein
MKRRFFTKEINRYTYDDLRGYRRNLGLESVGISRAATFARIW